MNVKRKKRDTEQVASRQMATVLYAVVWLALALAKICPAAAQQAEAIQPRQTGSKTAQPADVHVVRSVKIPMRDGVDLVADIYLPPGTRGTGKSQRVPAVLARTPYGRNVEGTLYGRFFAGRGYAFVTQDVRGRFDSEGDWAPFRSERDDGSDSIDWIVKQPWCSGEVAMFGASYGGMCAWYAATTAHPRLRAVIAMVNVNDPDQFMPFAGGVFHIGFAAWAKMLEAMEAPGGLASAAPSDWENAPRVRPLGEIDTFFKTKHNYVDEVLEHPLSDRAYWDRLSYLKQLSNAQVAGLHISGWFDVHRAGTFAAYEHLRQGAAAREGQHLIIGPWAHLGVNRSRTMGSTDFGPSAITDLDESMVKFLDHHLKGIENGFGDKGRVRFFVTGENKWRFANDWPPPDTHAKRLFLASSGKANLRSGGGRLGDSSDRAADADFDEYRYDPNDPPAFLGSMGLYPMPAPTEDKSKHPDRTDVLDYRSDAYSAAVELVGPVQAVLYVSTDAPDTDFAVELFRVTPGGAMYRLTGNVRRLRYHRGYAKGEPVTPGQITKLIIDCPPIGCRLNPGDKLHLQIGSAALPAYAPNLNKLDPIHSATESVIATSRVWHSPGRKSYITVPVRSEPAHPE